MTLSLSSARAWMTLAVDFALLAAIVYFGFTFVFTGPASSHKEIPGLSLRPSLQHINADWAKSNSNRTGIVAGHRKMPVKVQARERRRI